MNLDMTQENTTGKSKASERQRRNRQHWAKGFTPQATMLFFSWAVTKRMKVELKYKPPVLLQLWIDSEWFSGAFKVFWSRANFFVFQRVELNSGFVILKNTLKNRS